MKISVIIPTYNRATSLYKAIAQVRHSIGIDQKEVEIIVVDDCSGDHTPSLLLELNKLGLNIKIIRLDQNSHSVSIPRAVGIVNSTGDYIVHHDDDVDIFSTKLALLSKQLDENPDYMLVYGNRYDVQQIPYSLKYVACGNYKPNKTGVDSSQFMYRRSVYDHIPIHFAKRACDWNLMQKIWAQWPNSFGYIDTPVSTYTWHSMNRSLDDKTKRRELHPKVYSKYFNGTGYKIDYEVINAD